MQDADSLRAAALRSLFSGGGGRAARGGAALARDTALWPMLMGFAHAIDWREPCIVALLSLHAALLIIAVATRRSWWSQASLFVLVCAGVAAGPRVNAWAGDAGRWRRLGFTQNYFDARGIWWCCLVSAPLLLIAFAQMLMAFCSASSLLIAVKRMELKKHRAAKAAAEAAAAAAAGGGPAAAAVAAAEPADADADKKDRRKKTQ